jgi:L-methionine (R)-S-oxide reductase
VIRAPGRAYFRPRSAFAAQASHELRENVACMQRSFAHGAPEADYTLLERQVSSLLEGERDFIANAANFAAFVYEMLPNVNWAGFYFPDAGGLVLGPFAGKPACTRLPAGQGVCNRAFETLTSIVVDDVHADGNHIVCDSASKSELVVPLFCGDAICGVFDLDSPLAARFTVHDRKGMERLVARFIEHTPIPERYKAARPANVRLNERIDVQTCRDHHVVIRYLADELSRHDLDAANVMMLLGRLRNVLSAHLKLEDGWLYPRLAKSPNEIVRSKAERYSREMGSLAADFQALWKTWMQVPEAIENNRASWEADWRLFRAALLARMETEDTDLYVAAEADLG